MGMIKKTEGFAFTGELMAYQNYKINAKWDWNKSKEGKTIHHTGNLIGTSIDVHYSTDLSGMVDTDINGGRGYYVYWNDNNKEDEWFSNLGQAQDAILKVAYKESIERGK
tara:strand:+ start:41 stop:370 length:330 start_codon:yes stop_codon:yes gene_type:complete